MSTSTYLIVVATSFFFLCKKLSSVSNLSQLDTVQISNLYAGCSVYGNTVTYRRCSDSGGSDVDDQNKIQKPFETTEWGKNFI